MAKRPQVNLDVSSYIQVRNTQAQLDACIELHLNCLQHAIASPVPPDGTIPKIVAALDALRGRIVAIDDPAGRGLSTDEEF